MVAFENAYSNSYVACWFGLNFLYKYKFSLAKDTKSVITPNIREINHNILKQNKVVITNYIHGLWAIQNTTIGILR